MKKRLEKKAEKMRRKKVHEILEMVLEINGTYPRQREYSGSLPTAFFEFSGHVSRVYVQVIRDGGNDRGNLDDPDSNGMDVRTELDEMAELKGEIKEKQEELRHPGKMGLLRCISGGRRSPLREVPEGYETPDQP